MLDTTTLVMTEQQMGKTIICLVMLLSLSSCTKSLDVCRDKSGKVESCLKVFNDEQIQKGLDHEN